MSLGSPVPTAMLYMAGGSIRRCCSIATPWATQLSSYERFVVITPAVTSGETRQMSAGEMLPTSIRPVESVVSGLEGFELDGNVFLLNLLNAV